MKAKMICAWCDTFMHNTDTVDGSPSHGICKNCLRLYFPELAVAIEPDRATQAAAGITVTHNDPPHAE